VLKKLECFYYHENFIHELVKQKSSLDIVVFGMERSPSHTRDFILDYCDSNNIRVIEGIQRPKGIGRSLIYNWRETKTALHYLQRTSESQFYLNRWKSYLNKPLQRVFNWKFLRSKTVSIYLYQFIEQLEQILLPLDEITAFLANGRYDFLLATPANMRFSREIEYIKAAKKLELKSIVLAQSWDNLSTKGLFQVKPDYIFVWNKSHFDQAIDIHGFSDDRVKITGAGFFDKWFDIPLNLNEETLRSSFYDGIGLGESENYLLYLGSSASVGGDESIVVEKIAKYLENSEDPVLKTLKILVRPHPANRQCFEKLSHPLVVLWKNEKIFPGDTKDRKLFLTSVRQSQAVIGINTSGFIDALIMDRPVISLFWEKYIAVQKNAPHFNDLLSSNCLYLNRSINTLGELLTTLLDREQVDHSVDRAREKFIFDFIRPSGVEQSAGTMAVRYLDTLES
jgi:hypothetical protein